MSGRTIVGSNKELRFRTGEKVRSAFCVRCNAWYGQLGLEPSLDMYIEHLLEIMRELKRVLKKTGVIFWVHGDCYGGSGAGTWKNSPEVINSKENYHLPYGSNPRRRSDKSEVRPKCMALQNFRFIIRCVDELGLILRNVIIWKKPNHMPSSVKDRFTSAYEPVFMLTKSKKYWFDLCLSGDTEVYTREKGKIRPIKLRDLYREGVENREILTPHGWKEIKNIAKTNPKTVYKISAGHITSILASHNHRFPVSQRNKSIMFKQVKEISNKHDRDYLLFVPISKWINPTMKKIDLSDLGMRIEGNFAYHRRIRKYKIPKVLELDYDLGYFIGVWLAEGHIENDWEVAFALRKGEYLIDFLQKFLSKFKIHLTVSVMKGRNGVTAVFSNPVLVKLIKYFCIGNNANEKGLNREILLNTPAEFRKGILEGFMEGDGTSHKGALYTSIASKRLRDDLALLSSSLGYEYSIYEERIANKVYYGLRVFKAGKYKSRGRRLNRINRISFGRGSNQYNTKTIEEFEAYFVRSKTELINTNTDFYDLEVEGELFLINGGIVTHNSAVREPYKTGKWEKIPPIGGIKQTMGNLNPTYSGNQPPSHPLGKNPGDVWELSTEPFHDAHFAVFPTKLVERMIKAACPQEICKKCGKPRERIVERGGFVRTGGKRVKDTPAVSERQKREGTGYHQLFMVGWTDCGCNAGWESSVVLDPFLGSGTTALVALKLGRRFVGVEINYDYCLMALRRIEPYLKQRNLEEFS